MSSIPFKITVLFRSSTEGYSFGTKEKLVNNLVSDREERIFAFAIAERSRPRVFEYDYDKDGLEALANLIRSEEVISVVRGRRADFAHESVVSLSDGRDRMENRIIVSRNI